MGSGCLENVVSYSDTTIWVHPRDTIVFGQLGLSTQKNSSHFRWVNMGRVIDQFEIWWLLININ